MGSKIHRKTGGSKYGGMGPKTTPAPRKKTRAVFLEKQRPLRRHQEGGLEAEWRTQPQLKLARAANQLCRLGWVSEPICPAISIFSKTGLVRIVPCGDFNGMGPKGAQIMDKTWFPSVSGRLFPEERLLPIFLFFHSVSVWEITVAHSSSSKAYRYNGKKWICKHTHTHTESAFKKYASIWALAGSEWQIH